MAYTNMSVSETTLPSASYFLKPLHLGPNLRTFKFNAGTHAYLPVYFSSLEGSLEVVFARHFNMFGAIIENYCCILAKAFSVDGLSVHNVSCLHMYWPVVCVRNACAGERGCHSVLCSCGEEAPSRQVRVQRVHRVATRVSMHYRANTTSLCKTTN